MSTGSVNPVTRGADPAGNSNPVLVLPDGLQSVRVGDPVGSSAAVVTGELSPRVMIDPTEGILATDHQTFTGSGGTATVTNGLFSCTTSTTVGSYGVVRSVRTGRNRPGHGLIAVVDAAFPVAGVANSQIGAGVFNAEDGLFAGYDGTTFGFLRRYGGAAAIAQLTITTGAAGAETVTVTLNGTAFNYATGGALTATALAKALAESGIFTGWTSSVSPTANVTATVVTVTFIQNNPAATGGAFGITSTGTAAGSVALLRTGAANTVSTVARTAWNVDRLDGTRGTYNPSGVSLDTTYLTRWRFWYGLGACPTRLEVILPNGRAQTVCTLDASMSATTPVLATPTFRAGWFAASLGSTTALSVVGCVGSISVIGKITSRRDPFGTFATNASVGTSETMAFAVRARGEFANRLCQRAIDCYEAELSCATSNKNGRLRIVLNPTYVGAIVWSYYDQTTSAMEVSTTSGITITGGREIRTLISTTDNDVDLQKEDLRLEAGDTLAFMWRASGAGTDLSATFAWGER